MPRWRWLRGWSNTLEDRSIKHAGLYIDIDINSIHNRCVHPYIGTTHVMHIYCCTQRCARDLQIRACIYIYILTTHLHICSLGCTTCRMWRQMMVAYYRGFCRCRLARLCMPSYRAYAPMGCIELSGETCMREFR